MTSKTDVRLTSRQRLGRGLKYSAVGPVDVAAGALGLGLNSAHSSVTWVGNRYRKSQVARQLREDLSAAQDALAQEFAAAQEVVSNLPHALQSARKSRRRRRRLLVAAAAGVLLAGGAVAFSVIRRSSQREPSVAGQSRPPSVDVAPKP
jgi:alpha-D-ribose 1-methylphosphonate 5-triphosphate synthase subunit PhnG